MRLDTRNLERVQSRIREIQDLIGETTAPRKPAEGSAFAEVLAAVESGKKEEEAKKTKTLSPGIPEWFDLHRALRRRNPGNRRSGRAPKSTASRRVWFAR